MLDKVKYIKCGSEKNNLLHTSMNPYLLLAYDIPAGCDNKNARSEIIKGFKCPAVKNQARNFFLNDLKGKFIFDMVRKL